MQGSGPAGPAARPRLAKRLQCWLGLRRVEESTAASWAKLGARIDEKARGHLSSPDGRWLASGGYDTTIRICDASTGELCATLPQPDNIVRALAFGPDGQWLPASIA